MTRPNPHPTHLEAVAHAAASVVKERDMHSPIEAAAKAIYQNVEDQPWEASTVDEEAKFRKIAATAINAALAMASESPVVLEYAANAISQSSGMRFDGFWSRVDELEPEGRDYALREAQSAIAAAHTAIRLIEVVRNPLTAP